MHRWYIWLDSLTQSLTLCARRICQVGSGPGPFSKEFSWLCSAAAPHSTSRTFSAHRETKALEGSMSALEVHMLGHPKSARCRHAAFCSQAVTQWSRQWHYPLANLAMDSILASHASQCKQVTANVSCENTRFSQFQLLGTGTVGTLLGSRVLKCLKHFNMPRLRLRNATAGAFALLWTAQALSGRSMTGAELYMSPEGSPQRVPQAYGGLFLESSGPGFSSIGRKQSLAGVLRRVLLRAERSCNCTWQCQLPGGQPGHSGYSGCSGQVLVIAAGDRHDPSASFMADLVYPDGVSISQQNRPVADPEQPRSAKLNLPRCAPRIDKCSLGCVSSLGKEIACPPGSPRARL